MSEQPHPVGVASRALRRRQGLELLLTAEPLASATEGGSSSPLLDLAASTADTTYLVSALFRHVLGREADAEGLASWRASLERGASVRAVAEAMASSPEFGKLPRAHREAVRLDLASWNATSYLAELGLWPRARSYDERRVSDEIFVRALFEVAFHRAPDEQSLSHELSRLEAGVGRESMLRAFAASESVQHRFVGVRSGGLRGRLRQLRDRQSALATFRLLVALAEDRQIAHIMDAVSTARPYRGGHQ